MQNRPKRNKTLNPFYHRVELTLWDKIKIGLFTVTLLPIKILLLIPFLCLAELLVLIGLSGITFEESQSTQLSKWRRVVRWIIAHLVMKSIVFCSGFIWKIKETGKRATPEEAPIFVVGPHSSYFDSFVVILLGSPSIVAKLDTKDVPVFGRLVTFTQAVYVTRESKESRKQVMEALKQRAQGVFNGNGMPQIYIYPEGTTGNRSSLIKFKPGAFVPQVPVQPVLIRYPNVFDAVTYTFDGLSLKQNIWYALAQLYVNVEVEYLPVYVPSEAEKNDPNLFAENVRSVMSESLRIPMSDYQFEDGTLLSALRDETKFLHKLQTIHQAKKVFGVLDYRIETAMLLRGQGSIYMRQMNWRKNFVEFQAQFFNMGSEISSIPKVRDVFNSFIKNGEDSLDVRPYLVLASLLCNDKRYGIEVVEERIYEMYNMTGEDVDESELQNLIKEVFGMSKAEETKLATVNSETCGTGDDVRAKARIDKLRHQLARCVEFGKLFADEVTERLPKTYPSRQDRDKPSLKQKLY